MKSSVKSKTSKRSSKPPRRSAGAMSARKTSEALAELAALNKSRAVIEFAPDGTILTANDNFLAALGYTLAEIQGKHHRMFVEPAAAASAEYGDFWAKLARGEYQAAQFKRIAKGGKEIWIDASYDPVFDAAGKVFKVVKYATDITKNRLEYAELSGQVEAIKKSQAVIEFNLDGTIITANQNFLSAVGYSLGEIVGRHHSMFVDQAQSASSDYREFWAKLNSGEYQAAQYKRIAKGGKEIWIEASYNPILDMNRRPFKVVKYATDITKQVELLGDLKALIDQNFGEIDAAIDRSSSETQAATRAANETAGNVQVIASSAEELAASIREISESMARSKAATDTAFTQTATADQATHRLTAAAQAMGGIVDLIRGIAGQINLLALNATIESARAGDAGKGFAVVASEVKSLARQAGSATDQISKEIEGMQGVATDVVNSLALIRESIEAVREHVAGTASAVEEQSTVTQNMSANMQSSSNAVGTINRNVAEISAAILQAQNAVTKTKEAARVLAR